MTILYLPRPRDWVSRFLKTWAAARPSLRAVSAVTGSMLAVPRTPSVPKILVGWLMEVALSREGGLDGDGVGFEFDDVDAGRNVRTQVLLGGGAGMIISQVHINF